MKMLNMFYSVQGILIYPKNSDEYIKELNALLDSKQIDKNSTLFLLKFDHIYNKSNLPEAPLKEDNLNKLPNLFEGPFESNDYMNFLEILYNLFKDESKELVSQFILEYFNSYLEKIDLNNAESNQIQIGINIIHMLLYYYPIKDTEDEYKNIFMYLNKNEDTNSINIKKNFYPQCNFLRNLLHHQSNRFFRCKARDICQHFSIKLNPMLMIGLSIDGLKQEDGKINCNNLVLVVGETGSGKSTTINYFAGVEYERKISKITKVYYLKQKDEKKTALARVGHNIYKSETLYPQIIPINKDISFCDFPGFNESGDDFNVVCAALALPIAVHHAKDNAIKALLVVISWDSISELRGKTLLNTLKTVHSITKNNPNIELFYLITRPPKPPDQDEFEGEFDEYVDPEKIAKTACLNISNVVKNQKNNNKAKQDITSKNLATFYDQKDEWVHCLKILKNGENIMEGNPNRKGYIENYVLPYIDKKNYIEKGKLVNLKEDFIKKLQTDHIRESSIKKMEKFIEDIINHHVDSSKNESMGNTFISLVDQKKTEIEDAIEKLAKMIVDLNNETENDNEVIEFLEKMINSSQKIFIIRGYEYQRMYPDHKKKLLEQLTKLFDSSEKSVEFKFSYDQGSFKIVKDWVISESMIFKNKINALNDKKNMIKIINKDISDLDERKAMEMIFLKKSLLKSTDKSEEEIISIRKKNIYNLSIKKKFLKNKLNEIEQSIYLDKSKIEKISQLPSIEYDIKLYAEKRNLFGRFLSTASYCQYTFPRIYYENPWSVIDWFNDTLKTHILPIDYVEMSCLLDSNDKIIFKTPLGANCYNIDEVVKQTSL